MATKKTAKKAEKMFKVTVKTNPNFCGIGAGGVQFAYGQAVISEGRMCEWFKEHSGYEVTEVEEPAPDPVPEAENPEE